MTIKRQQIHEDRVTAILNEDYLSQLVLNHVLEQTRFILNETTKTTVLFTTVSSDGPGIRAEVDVVNDLTPGR